CDVRLARSESNQHVGRTGLAEMTGEAFTFVAPDEESDLRQIERAIGKGLPRVTLPDFDYKGAGEKLEIPLAQRIAEIRARKAEERARAKAKAERRNQKPEARSQNPGTRSQKPGGGQQRQGSGRPHSGGSFRPRRRRR